MQAKKQAKLPHETRWFNVLLLLLCFIFLLAIRLYVNHDITGDEPHYLLMDYSLVHDRDLNLANNYANNDARGFYTVERLSNFAQIGPGSTAGENPREYSIHAPGIPFLLLPGFLVSAKVGSAIEMVGVATIVVWLTFAWTVEVTKRKKLGYIAAASLLICYFFNGLAGYLYPDLVIAAITLAALIIITKYYRRPAFQVLFGFLISCLPLMHLKAYAMAAPLFLVMFYRVWSTDKKLILWAILGGLPLLLYAVLTMHGWYGIWDPRQIYPPDVNVTLNASPLQTIPAMLFDANRGLLVYNPIVLLVFVGLPIWFKQRRQSLIVALCAIAPTVLLLVLFDGWQGGGAPIGRYIMDFLPVLFPAVAFAIIQARQAWQKLAVGLLVATTIFITLNATFTKIPYIPPTLFKTRPVFFAQIEKRTSIGFDHLLVTYTNKTKLEDSRAWAKLTLGFTALAGLTAYGYILSKPLKPIKEK